MQKEIITKKVEETKKLGETLAKETLGTGSPNFLKKKNDTGNSEKALIICLSGELGAGKTTFSQGLLEGLGLRGPFTSPTFLIMKEYVLEIPNSKLQISNKTKIRNVYHIDAYRVEAEDILELGWEEMVASENNIIIIEWAERAERIIPKNSLWIEFKWLNENERKIIFRIF